MRALRLVGQGIDERWPEGPHTPADDQAAFIASASAWVADRLAQSRAAGVLEMLCLDAEGAACTWLASPSADPTVVAALARLGPADSLSDLGATGTAPAAGVFEFFAADPTDSTIQPLSPPATTPPRGAKEKVAPIADRLGVLAQTDVPARLLMDALDRAGIETRAAVSVYHAIALAWDPASPLQARASSERVVAESHDRTIVLVIDPGDEVAPPRALWAWSKEGALLAAGSIRLRARSTDDRAHAVLDAADAARLASEWMAWSLQLGLAPARVIAVFPEALEGDPSAFGQALLRHWPGATLDAVVDRDPIGATLARLASALESTPASRREEPVPGRALVDLSSRPGRVHRRLYRWAALFVLVASALACIVGWQVRNRAADARSSATDFQKRWSEELKAVYPQAFAGAPGTTPLFNLKLELDKRRQEAGPSRLPRAAPVMEELETISLVLASADDVALENIELTSGGTAKLVVLTKDLRAAEKLSFALRQIAGSHADWEKTDPNYANTNDAKGQPATRMTYNALWNLPPEEGK